MTHLKIMEERDSPGNGPTGLAWTGHVLWNADYSTGTLYALDLDTGEIQDRIMCPGVLSGVGWDGHSLWQALMDEGWLRNINPQTHDYDRTIVIESHGRLSGVTWDGRQLWVVSQQNGQLLAIDREGADVRHSLAIPVAAGGVAYKDGHLWLGFPETMSYQDGEFQWLSAEKSFAVAQLEAETGRELARYPLDFLPLGLAWVGDDLWMSSAAHRKLLRARLVD